MEVATGGLDDILAQLPGTHTHTHFGRRAFQSVSPLRHTFHQIRRNFKRASGGNTTNKNRAGDKEADGMSGSISGRLRLSRNMQVTAGTDSGAAASLIPQLISSKTPGSYWEGSFYSRADQDWRFRSGLTALESETKDFMDVNGSQMAPIFTSVLNIAENILSLSLNCHVKWMFSHFSRGSFCYCSQFLVLFLTPCCR